MLPHDIDSGEHSLGICFALDRVMCLSARAFLYIRIQCQTLDMKNNDPKNLHKLKRPVYNKYEKTNNDEAIAIHIQSFSLGR